MDMGSNDFDFVVSDARRDVWNAEIEILEIVKSICDKYSIPYFADGGTLLGAIRHGGFIPWDDDIDLAMLRADYDRFIAAAKTDLPEGYFLQLPETDEDYFYGHAKIRKDGTTAIRYIQYPEKYKHHQGVFIDIFPLDNIPDNPVAYRIHKTIALKLMQIIYYAKYYYRLNQHSNITKLKHRICTLLLPTNAAIYRAYRVFEKWILIPNRTKTKTVGVTALYYHLDKTVSWNREWFESAVVVPFEATQISIPKEYDKILTKTFGDYLEPQRASSQHGDVFFDLNHDYRDYYDGKLAFNEEPQIL